MGNALTILTHSEDLSSRSSWSQSTLGRRSKSISGSTKSHHSASNLILRGASNDGVEDRPQRRLWKARQGITASRPTSRTRQHRASQTAQSESGESQTSARSQQSRNSNRTSLNEDPGLEGSHSIQTTENNYPSNVVTRTERVEKEAKKECKICTESRLLSRFPERPPTASCTHEPSTCRRCLRKWIDSSFRTKAWNQINCPECCERLQDADVKAFADPKLFIKYEELATKAELEAIRGFRWCIAKRCSSGQVHEEGERMPKFVCFRCKAEHCVIHQVPWHKRETCAQYEYRTKGKKKEAQDTKTCKWLEKKTKRCPGCGWNIQKDGGCGHMTCLKCGYEFCFQCLGSVVEENYMRITLHQVGCSHRG